MRIGFGYLLCAARTRTTQARLALPGYPNLVRRLPRKASFLRVRPRLMVNASPSDSAIASEPRAGPARATTDELGLGERGLGGGVGGVEPEGLAELVGGVGVAAELAQGAAEVEVGGGVAGVELE